MAALGSPSLVACAWCGLLSEGGPVCTICGSPVLDIAGRTTVLDVSWPLEPLRSAGDLGRRVGHQWVTLGEVSDLFRIPEPSLRSWLDEAPPPPMPDPPRPPARMVEPVVEPETMLPSLWVAPVPTPLSFRLGEAWAFQPTEAERRTIRMEMLKSRGATILAAGIGAAGIVYLIDHALR